MSPSSALPVGVEWGICEVQLAYQSDLSEASEAVKQFFYKSLNVFIT